MNLWMLLVLAVLGSYLLGSIPTGYWVGRLLKGIDIREHGSKSTGATNVLRTLGKGPALLVLLVDVLKGVAAVTLARWLFNPVGFAASLQMEQMDAWQPWMAALAALLAVVGHSKSPWIGFKGGKSAATGLGVLFALNWQVGLVVAAVFLSVLAIARIVSLGSIAAALAAPVAMLLLGQPLPFVLVGLVAGGYVLITHRANIQRLLAGQEPQIGQKVENP
ncbi:MAG: glycerol-3-phosphate 1-O-acyltransferase PlsY [Kaiparowitsia implicata GSE-PSE-MK54-09C]|jgi:glycerol-3-phosphate acyltransferase PlsY|nr:glycerol-3-phosphate 1-O-acyltransferase PlsY [Kaiparowitsia implicata GSE-PSE-MK54-09C]